MKTCPHSYSNPVFGHQKHGKAQANRIRIIVLNMNYLRSNIITVTPLQETSTFGCLLESAFRLAIANGNLSIQMVTN